MLFGVCVGLFILVMDSVCVQCTKEWLLESRISKKNGCM